VERKSKWAKLVEDLDDLVRLASDIKLSLGFRDRLEATNGFVDLIVFGNGESVFTKLSDIDIKMLEEKISKLSKELLNKTKRFNQKVQK